MGEVYRAEDTNLSREVAIKVLPEQFTQDPQRLARFEREAKLLAQLNHPNIAAIYGLEEADGVRFLALELVPGETLQERVAKGPVPVEEALEICRQIAEGVEAAHEKGVIHRDLKPANVKVTPEGKVKILDFGLAKAFEAETPVTDISQSPTLTEEMTRAGVILGTAAYMSPEQAKGKPVDKRADIFAFGAVLYELLTGKRAFEGETITETLGAIIHKEPEWDLLPGATPSLIRSLLRRCLQKDQDRRLRDIGDVKIEIEDALAEPTTVFDSAAQPVRQRWAITASLVMAAVVVTGVTAWLLIQPETQKPVTQFTINPPSTARLERLQVNQLAISPDGRTVIYISPRQGNLAMYLRHLDDPSIELIRGAEGGGVPFFSPNGQSVGFTDNGELRTVPSSGGPARTLCQIPGGAQLVGASWFEDTIVFGTFVGNGLYSVSASGGEPKSLTVPDAEKGEINYVFPQVLPGGQTVLFSITGADGEWQTAVLSLETGAQQTIIKDAQQATYVPTGHIVYAQPRTAALMAVVFDLETLEVTTDPVPVLEGVSQSTTFGANYALSEGGTLVYIPPPQDVQSLVWVDRNGVESVLTREEVSFGTPRISPHGDMVSLAISESGDTQQIWIYNLEGDPVRQVTFGSGSSQIWSPDGKWIIFQMGNTERNISRQLADGSAPIEILVASTQTPQTPSSVHPDGSVLLFGSTGGTWIAPMDGGTDPQPMSNSANRNVVSKFSPDGKWIAYVSDELGTNNVYVMGYPPTPDVKWLISVDGGGAEPVWSLDGTELFYRVEDKMMAVPVQTGTTFSRGNPEVLFEGSYVRSRYGGITPYYDISLDGQRFLMIKQEQEEEPQINVILNWTEELKRLVPTDR